MIIRKLLAACASLLLFAATAVAAEGKGEEIPPDLWLTAKIVTAYTLNQHLNPFKLDVDVKDGVARLGGTVDSGVERDLAVEIAKGVEGITKVEEDIRIEPGVSSGERSEAKFFRAVEDATITAKVKSKLLWNRNTNGLDINVDTERGIVTLTGKVASTAQRDLAVHLAKNTTGVEEVKAGLEVVAEAGKVMDKGSLGTMETKVSDAWITARVKSLLLFSKETAGATIGVSTSAQVVTLTGTVVNEEQKAKILKIVGDMVGVKAVHSEVTVEKG